MRSIIMRTLLQSQYPQLSLSAATSTTATPDPADSATVDSDIVVILAALLCALICILGLALIARCAFLRRPSYSSSNSNPSQHQQQQQQQQIEIQIPVPRANQGLKKKALKSLPKVRYGGRISDVEKHSECVICLTDFEEGEDIRVLPMCGHEFHVGCIDTWLRAHSSCPSCRRILVVVAPPVQWEVRDGSTARKGPERDGGTSSFLP